MINYSKELILASKVIAAVFLAAVFQFINDNHSLLVIESQLAAVCVFTRYLLTLTELLVKNLTKRVVLYNTQYCRLFSIRLPHYCSY